MKSTPKTPFRLHHRFQFQMAKALPLSPESPPYNDKSPKKHDHFLGYIQVCDNGNWTKGPPKVEASMELQGHAPPGNLEN